MSDGSSPAVGRAREATARVGGAVVGAVVGGIALTCVGYLGILARPGPNLAWGVFFVLSFVGALFGMVSPLGVFFFLGARQESRVREQLFRAAGVGSLFVFYPLIGLVGSVVLGATGLVLGSPLEVLVVFDALGGVTVGGILGFLLAERRIERHAAGFPS